MVNIIKAEYQKTGRSMSRGLIWAFPTLTFALAFVLTLGMTNAYAESVWNWWYTLLLPGMLAIICYLSMLREKKTGYYHLTTVPGSKKKRMLGKIISIGCAVLASNMILFTGASLGGFLLTTRVPLPGATLSVLVLTVTQLWEIPLFLFFSDRFGMVAELLVCLFLTVGGTILASTGKWYLFVSAIPMRVLCPFLHIMPNGLPAEAGNPFLDTGIVVPGICLSILWFLFTTICFLRWFEKREVK
ncbi:MAG: lantibiotic immunity ABC transporter MutE/EpiE family permease subunit [Lachnospiraceae bacterium]|nr:lantibiotic immunity ABC transporter MutE/EpiE family permease subunit [Lachnospiraceae bacterium]MCI9135343.1 lantibiotic immunity ABC transporter MutE/EpiE family permease subunit [Lachnospiraceae bacterium]